jgi:hypothetical protein
VRQNCKPEHEHNCADVEGLTTEMTTKHKEQGLDIRTTIKSCSNSSTDAFLLIPFSSIAASQSAKHLW